MDRSSSEWMLLWSSYPCPLPPGYQVDMSWENDCTRPRSLFAPITRPATRPSLLTLPTLLTNHSINQTQVLAHRLQHHRFLLPSLLSALLSTVFTPTAVSSISRDSTSAPVGWVQNENKVWLVELERDKKQIAMVLATHDRWEWKGEQSLIDKNLGELIPVFGANIIMLSSREFGIIHFQVKLQQDLKGLPSPLWRIGSLPSVSGS